LCHPHFNYNILTSNISNIICCSVRLIFEPQFYQGRLNLNNNFIKVSGPNREKINPLPRS